jgi:hypothetical protein
MRGSIRKNEGGFALAGAILALTVIAAMIAGAFFAARQELSIGRSSQTYQRAFGVAEAGLDRAIAAWQANITTLNGLTAGATAGPFVTTVGTSGTDSSWVTRLNDQLFLISSTGSSAGSRRRLAALARLQVINMALNGALTTRGQLRVGGSSFIDGVNQAPVGWGCSLPTDTVAGIYTRDSSQITTSGCTNYSCVRGKPKIQNDASINDSTFFQFGDMQWSDLTSMASVILPANIGTLTGVGPTLSGLACNTANIRNWGEPGNPPPTFTVVVCRTYFPIIYAQGNLKITGGRGQGILLVEGNLDVQGRFEFYGPVIVRGELNTQGTGGHFNGGVMAANVHLDQSDVLGNAVITYSSCAILEALRFNSPGRLIGQRAWAEVTQ